MCRSLLVLCLAWTCLIAKSWAGEIALVMSDQDAPYTEFSTELARGLSGSDWQIRFIGTPENWRDDADIELIVTAGSEAFRAMLAKKRSAPLLATLLPRAVFEEASREKGRGDISAIHLDQPPARQVAFINHLLPGSQRIGLLTGDQSRQALPAFRQAFARTRLILDVESSAGEAGLLPALDSLLPHIDALLIIPDASLYKRNTVKPLLVNAYRHRRPVIAFSAAFVKAGALAALYATPDQIGRQAATQILRQGARLPTPAGPTEFTISINHSVAESFGLRIPEEAQLHRLLGSDGEAR